MPTHVQGQVRLHGEPVTDADVVAVTGEVRFGASAPVGPDGAFGLPIPAGTRDLLVRVRHPAVVIAVHPLPAGGELSIDLSPRLFHLSGEIVGDRPEAPPLTLFVDPASVDGVPPDVVPLTLQQAPAVWSSHYLPLAARDRFSVTVAAGTYRVGGGRINHDSPLATPGAALDVTVARVHGPADGTDYAGDPWSGFAVPMYADTAVTLVLRVVADHER